MRPSHHPPSFIAPLTGTPLHKLRHRHHALPTPRHNLSANPPARPRARPRRRAPTLHMREADPLTESKLGAPQVLCHGELLYDLMSNTPTASTTTLSEWTPHVGGAPSNVASCLSTLSTPVALLANVGDDTAGKMLRAAMASRDVNVDGVASLPRTATRRIFVRRDANGERAFVGFAGDNATFADAKYMNADDVPGLLFYAARMFVTGTLGLAFPGSANAVRELIDIARSCKLLVAVDVNWRPMIWAGHDLSSAREAIRSLLTSADVVKASLEDIAFLWGDDVARCALQTPEVLLQSIGSDMLVHGVLITGGERGAAYAFRTSRGDVVSGFVDAVVVPTEGVVDTTGAGDAFLGGFLSQVLKLGGLAFVLERGDMQQVVRFASCVAAFCVGGNGGLGALRSREQVEEMFGPFE